MDTVKVSPKFQIVIPKEIREDMNLRPGERLAIIEKGNIIHLVPLKSAKELRGIARGVAAKGIRDEAERFD